MVKTIETLEDFREFISEDKFVLVDFYANWCGPCRMIAPFLAQLEEENKDKMIVCKISVDGDIDDITNEFDIRIESIPLFIGFKNGGKVGSVTGANKAKLQALVANNL